MNNVLVVGGSYFAGRVFVEELIRNGDYAVYVMNRGNRPLGIQGVEEIICDRHDAFSIGGLIPNLEWHSLVDFCAYEPNDVDILLYNIPGSLNHYIYFSTSTVCENSLDIPMTEDSPKLTGSLPGPYGDYGYKKWLTELKLREICEQKGVHHTSLRPAFIYGKYNYAPRESYFFKLLADNKTIVVPFLPQSLFTTVSVWDIAHITISCLGNKKVFDDAFNISAPELICYDKLVRTLETITGNKLDVQRLLIDTIDAQRIPLPFPLDEHLVYSGEKIARTIGFEYTSYLNGMTRTYNHYFGIRDN